MVDRNRESRKNVKRLSREEFTLRVRDKVQAASQPNITSVLFSVF